MTRHLREQWRARARRGERVVYTPQVGTGGLFASLSARKAATERRLYRGLSVQAPAGIARRYQQMVARGYPTEADLGALNDFLAQALGDGLGTHWTTTPRVATSFATGGQGIPVLITARAEGNQLQDPAFWDESEFQVEAGTQVEVADVQVLDPDGGSVMFVDPTGLPKTAARVPPYYHGTTSKLSPGDVLLPGDQVGKRMHPDLGYRTDEVYLADKAYATFYALLAMNKSQALDFHVYEVEPLGDVIPGYGEYTTSSARVIREVEATLADLEPWMVQELGIGGKVETSDEPYLDPDTEVRGWDYPYPGDTLRASWGRMLADGYEVGIDRYDLNEFAWYVAHPPSDPNLRNIREGTERSESEAKRAINRALREMRS